MKFSDIPSHAAVKERLREMADRDRIPHAILLEGPAGIGKLAMARAFAQYIHCTDRRDGEPCGNCPACIQSQKFNHIDTHYVYPVVKEEGMVTPPVSSDFMEEWRNFLDNNPWAEFEKWRRSFTKKNAQPVIYVTESDALIHRLAFTSHASRYRTVIFWLPERMNVETANKLLKLIEEPYPDTIFIMVSNTPAEILPTIYSRVQRVEMKRLPDSDIASYIARAHCLSEQDSMAIAHNAGGSLSEAERAISIDGDRAKFFELFVRLMRLSYQRKVKELRQWADEVNSLGREEEMGFYDYSMRLLRENFVYNFRTPPLNYMNTDESKFAVNFARFINEVNVEKMMRVFDDAYRDIAGNSNGKIVNFDLSIKIILLIKSGLK